MTRPYVTLRDTGPGDASPALARLAYQAGLGYTPDRDTVSRALLLASTRDPADALREVCTGSSAVTAVTLIADEVYADADHRDAILRRLQEDVAVKAMRDGLSLIGPLRVTVRRDGKGPGGEPVQPVDAWRALIEDREAAVPYGQAPRPPRGTDEPWLVVEAHCPARPMVEALP